MLTHPIKNYYRIILLLGCGLIIILRAPNLLIHPRFWAEEGSTYFAYAFNNPWYKAIITPQWGYYSFFNNISVSLAQLAPLRYAPFVTTYLSFLVQMLPYSIILWGRSHLWNSPIKKIISCLIILFIPSLTGEIWLNIINSHFHFAVIAFLILLEPSSDTFNLKSISLMPLLIIAGLTSGVSAFLAPIYLLTFIREKKRERLVQTMILVICLVIQILVVGYAIKNGCMEGRLTSFELKAFFISIFFYGLIAPFFGTSWVGYLFLERILSFLKALNGANLYFIAIVVLCIAIMGISRLRTTRQMTLKTLGSSFLVLVLSIIFSLRGIGGFRHAYAPNIMLLFFLFYLWLENKNKIVKIMALLFIVISLSFGISQYRHNMKGYNYYREWPNWSEEVGAWQKEPERPLKIWPQEIRDEWKEHNWQINLKKKKQRRF